MDLHYNESPAASWLKQSPAATWITQRLSGPINVAPNERLISIVTGGVLLLNALIRPRLSSLVSGVVGGFLFLSRGATGHCPVYARLGKKELPLKGTDSAPSQFAQQQSESVIQSRSAAPSDVAASTIGLGTTGADPATHATSPSLPLGGGKKTNKTHAKN